MVDASARYILTADDRSRAGVESFRRNLRAMHSQVVASNRGMSGMLGAFARFTPAGIAATVAFVGIRKALHEYRDVLEATAKAHPELAAAMQRVSEHQVTGSNATSALTEAYEEQARVLQDPSVMAAQKAFADWLLSVKTRAVEAKTWLLEMAGAVRKVGVEAGVFDPRNPEELNTAREGHLSRLGFEGGNLLDMQSRRPLTPAEQARLDAIERELVMLRQIEQIEAKLQDFRLGDMAAPQLQILTEEEVKAAEEMARFLRDITEGINEIGREASEGLTRGMREFVSDEVQALRTRDEILRESYEEQLEQGEELRAQRLRDAQEWSDGTKLAIGGIKDAIEDMIHTGKFNWRSFVKFMAAELAKREIFDALDAIGDAFTGRKRSGGSGGGFLRSLFGFQHGGSFTVGGSGGPDSQLVAFAASPRERVTVSPPGRGGGMVFSPTYYIDAKGADAERVLAVVPIAMEQTHERAVGTFLQIMRKNGFRLT